MQTQIFNLQAQLSDIADEMKSIKSVIENELTKSIEHDEKKIAISEQESKIELISSLVALADATKDEVTSVMLRFAVKQILQRDFKIDFDSGVQEEKPHIPQPKSI